jgi:hypothetical protein
MGRSAYETTSGNPFKTTLVSDTSNRTNYVSPYVSAASLLPKEKVLPQANLNKTHALHPPGVEETPHNVRQEDSESHVPKKE